MSTGKLQIAVAADDDKGLEGQVSQHFGRCPYYALTSIDSGRIVDCQVRENPFFDNHQPGQIPAFIETLGANVILAGGMGPRAIQLFESFNIDVATGFDGKVNDAVQAYIGGEVQGTVPCSHDHPNSCQNH